MFMTMEKYRKTVMTARLIHVEGRLQRHKDIIHVIANRLYDRSDWLSLLDEEAQKRLKKPRQTNAPRHAHPRNVRIIPRSRDFH